MYILAVRLEKRHQAGQLASGMRAGAGWELRHRETENRQAQGATVTFGRVKP